MTDYEFGFFNYLIILIYLIVVVFIGIFSSRKPKTLNQFFLGGRKISWIAVGMSMFASVTSATTLIAVPALVFYQNTSFLIFGISSICVAPIIIKFLYKKFHKNNLITSYQFIQSRFGKSAKYITAALYVVFRLTWLGLVIYAPSIALNITTGIPLIYCIIIIGIFATLYTTIGGISAVIYTDVLQFIVLLIGTIWIFISLNFEINGSFFTIINDGQLAQKFNVFDWKNISLLSVPLVGIHFFFQLMYDYGTDQITVQRMMSTGSLKNTKKAIIFNAIADFIIISLLVFIGLGLFSFYKVNNLPDIINGDMLLPYYIVTQLPNGLSGVIIAAIFAAAMSSLDSGLNSLTTVIMNDFKIIKNQSIINARKITILLGIISIFSALIIFKSNDLLIENFYNFMSLFCAPILSLFILGALTKFATFQGWIFGLSISILSIIWLKTMDIIHTMYLFTCSFLICTFVSIIMSLLLNIKNTYLKDDLRNMTKRIDENKS